MDERLHGSTVMASQAFKHSIGILEKALDEATSIIPNEVGNNLKPMLILINVN